MAGTAPTLEQAAADADVIIDDPTPHRHLQLVPAGRSIRAAVTLRELDVVRLLAEGLQQTYRHVSHILTKLNLSARAQVAVYALRTGLA